MLKRLFVWSFALVLLAACANPKQTVLPQDTSKWEAELKPTLEKLTTEDKELLAGYLVRLKLGEAFGVGAALPIGITVGEAIENQRKFKVEQEAKASAEKAVKERKEAEAKALKEQVEKQRAELVRQFDDTLLVSFVGKGFQPSDYKNNVMEDSITFKLAFSNKSKKDIAGFKGLLYHLKNERSGQGVAQEDPRLSSWARAVMRSARRGI